MAKTPYLQLEYVVTLCLNEGQTCEIITECLAIDTKSFPKLFDASWRKNPCNIVLCLKYAAEAWHNDVTRSVGIINYWYKDSVEAYLDNKGNVKLD